MNEKEKKQERAKKIGNLINEFCNRYLNDELHGYAIKLLEKLNRKKTYSITSGKIEIWASAIIYVIARLNFLFDSQNPIHISPDTICDFFGTKKSTGGNKATDIEKACKIRIGEEGFCNPEISDSFSFVQLPNGIVLTKKMAKEAGLL
ncbi:MAG: hypothetical protein JSV88_24965 [Candidatus Aminicenantes bacterium]|nr:MAG: hypothetical protein JSV88_24965 [Candidatus Aminicenantes bacterium]